MSKMANYVTVNSPEHFQELLSQDLERLSVLNFRAEWAGPCAQMDAVAKELASKHPSALFLEIEAEAVPEVSESFDVESVPHFVLLRGHTLIETISGAQALPLSKAVEKHASGRPAGQPLSTSDKAPAAPPAAAANGSSAAEADEEDYSQEPAPENETEEQLEDRCNKLMNQADVVLFMKGNPSTPRCGFSNTTTKILREAAVPFKSFDILQDEAVRQHLKQMNEWPTFPQLIIKGEFVGGLDILKEMVTSGEFAELTQGI